ncbi:hypothetical protein EIN_417050 [Entamoeba invadens IP1]|uniref:RhoGAP domain containing protein n=1 Tax=Entamoeba invadens IP1 TaxID=370355 RepID=A0A0A1TWD6_ENTIV|nr:hypothetical protein EIN_417050 [Entamoeba invadens IP1]ELP83626.1 hypothetical protein EIN_417050 [Entamoeba invadens IP1]|eukprot:XP_004182972.1 hypothetical protein EIN_417050 [Entamoeba invadens IP1]
MSSSSPTQIRHRLSRDSNRASTQSDDLAYFPSRRMTLDSTLLQPISSPKSTPTKILQENKTPFFSFKTSQVPQTREIIVRTMESLLNTFKKALFVQAQFEQSTPRQMKEDISGLQEDILKESFDKFFKDLDDVSGILSPVLNAMQTNLENLYYPLVSFFQSYSFSILTNFLSTLKKNIIDLEKLQKDQQKYRLNSITCSHKLVKILIEIVTDFNCLVPLFDVDKMEIQRRVDAQEILVQFKSSNPVQLMASNISLSELLWAKSVLRNSSLFSSQLAKATESFSDFVNAHEVIMFIQEALFQRENNSKGLKEVFDLLDEDKILTSSVMYVLIQTNDNVSRYHKSVVCLTQIGVFVFVLFSGNFVIFADFISAKTLSNATIEITSSLDQLFVGDLHITLKDDVWKKEFVLGFLHTSDLIEWSALLKEHLLSFALTNQIEYKNDHPIASKLYLKKLNKKQKYVGSSVEELISIQQSVNSIDLIPDILRKCVNGIIKSGLGVDGLFRKPPDQDELEELMKKLTDTDFRNTTTLEYPISTLCGLLKAFLMEMSPRFITEKQYETFFKISKVDDGEKRTQIEEFINVLSTEQFIVLKEYVYLLTVIAANQKLNRMGAQNLSTAICQCFLPQKNTVDFASLENDAFECLITNSDLFDTQITSPAQLPQISCFIKRQCKGEGAYTTTLFIEPDRKMVTIDKAGSVQIIDVDDYSSDIVQVNFDIPDLRYAVSVGKCLIVGTKTMLYSISTETKEIIRTSEKKRCSFITSANGMLLIGEQHGVIEVIDPTTFNVEKTIHVEMGEDQVMTVPVITHILPAENMLFVVGLNLNEIVVMSLFGDKKRQTILTPHKSSISCLIYSEENKTLWSGDSNGLICVFSTKNNDIISKTQCPTVYGKVVALQKIKGYVIATFISSQIVVFNCDNCSVVETAKTNMFVSSKSGIVVERNHHGTKSYNLWMEKDNSGDTIVLDISYPSGNCKCDIIDNMDSFVTNKYFDKTPLGHCFCQTKTVGKCSVCGGSFSEGSDCYKCLNCDKHIHSGCVAKFSLTQCEKNAVDYYEVINKPK